MRNYTLPWGADRMAKGVRWSEACLGAAGDCDQSKILRVTKSARTSPLALPAFYGCQHLCFPPTATRHPTSSPKTPSPHLRSLQEYKKYAVFHISLSLLRLLGASCSSLHYSLSSYRRSYTDFVRPQMMRLSLIPKMDSRRYACKHGGCGKTFARKEHLARHEKSHVPANLLQCPACKRHFNRKFDLQFH